MKGMTLRYYSCQLLNEWLIKPLELESGTFFKIVTPVFRQIEDTEFYIFLGIFFLISL